MGLLRVLIKNHEQSCNVHLQRFFLEISGTSRTYGVDITRQVSELLDDTTLVDVSRADLWAYMVTAEAS
jgi:hypothetical protein